MKYLKIIVLVHVISFQTNAAELIKNGSTWTFTNTSINDEEKQTYPVGSGFLIPATVDTVHIEKNLTVTGSFLIENSRASSLTIEGDNSDNSVLEGEDLDGHRPDNDKKYHGIGYQGSHTIYLKKFKSLNANFYHQDFPNAKVIAEDLKIESPVYHPNQDGLDGAANSTFNNIYINTNDDAIKVYRNGQVYSNIKIVHNNNGAPIQLGWGTGINNITGSLHNIEVISNGTNYNMGVISRAGGDGTVSNLTITGYFNRSVNSGKKKAYLYQFGSGSRSASNATFNITGKTLCETQSTANTNYRSGSVNSIVTLDCFTGLDNLNAAASNYQIFPNPANEQCTISGLKQNEQVSILTLQGQLVGNYKAQHTELTISTYGLIPGIYLVKADRDIFKLIVE